MMRLKKYWDFNDRSLIVNGKNISQTGWETYWMSIDSAVQFWERHLAPKSLGFSHLLNGDKHDHMIEVFQSHNVSKSGFYQGRTSDSSRPKNSHHGDYFGRNDKFHWRRTNNWQQRRQLLKPPAN